MIKDVVRSEYISGWMDTEETNNSGCHESEVEGRFLLHTLYTC